MHSNTPEIDPKERTLPVVVREIKGDVHAIFYTLPAKAGCFMSYSIGVGWHEIESAMLHGSTRIPYEHRVQLFAILKNLGKTNIKYYDSARPWFDRDRRIAEELQVIEQIEKYKRTNRGS